MKKMAAVLCMILSMAVLFCACSSNNDESKKTNTTTEENKEIKSSKKETAKQAETTKKQSKILVAYFSWSGNTEKIAKMIAEDTGADLFKIETKTAYTDDYDTLVDQAQQEQKDDARPELKNTVKNFEQYDTVFLGYPNWWSDVPMAINTFMESYDWNGKNVIPFCTHGGGGFGGSLSSVRKGTKKAKVLKGFEVEGSSADSAKEDVQAWIKNLNIK